MIEAEVVVASLAVRVAAHALEHLRDNNKKKKLRATTAAAVHNAHLMEVGVAVTVWDAERAEPLDEPRRRLLTAHAERRGQITQ